MLYFSPISPRLVVVAYLTVVVCGGRVVVGEGRLVVVGDSVAGSTVVVAVLDGRAWKYFHKTTVTFFFTKSIFLSNNFIYFTLKMFYLLSFYNIIK